jgi:hypothetical protein
LVEALSPSRWQLWLGIGLGLGTDFQLVRVGDSVAVRGRVARSKVPAVEEFARRDLDGAGPFAVAGTFGPGRSIRFRWAGRIGEADRQRVRNVLIELLR